MSSIYAPVYVYECWYDEVDEGTEAERVTASTAWAAAEVFIKLNHAGDERSLVVVRDAAGEVTEWDVTSKMEWTHTVRPSKGKKG